MVASQIIVSVLIFEIAQAQVGDPVIEVLTKQKMPSSIVSIPTSLEYQGPKWRSVGPPKSRETKKRREVVKEKKAHRV